MKDGDSSQTARSVAVLRAAHQVIDAEPRILDDPVIGQLLDPSTLEVIRSDPERFRSPGLNALRAHVVIRSRYAEERLAAAVARGIRQYVILGAGFDTFAYRQPPWAERLRIFEVDHPASQRAKRERLDAAQVAIPANLEFVPIDFEVTRLRDGLRACSFDPTMPTFASWLGVMMYLSADAVAEVFRFVVALPRSSEIVFTFASSQGTDPERSRLATRAAAHGEPWRTWFAPDDLVRQLRATGFSQVTLLTPVDSEERYIRDRNDGLRAPRRTSIASATV
jgi:methyltransferase (TIGR00027 family)